MNAQNCAVSNIHEWYQPRIEPLIIPTTTHTNWQITAYPPKGVLELFEDLVAAARKLDTALGLPDCDTATKTKWMAELRRQVKAHEIKRLEERLKGA